MNEQSPIQNIDRLLFQLALETRELSQKKNELKEKNKVFRTIIAETRTHIEAVKGNVKKIEEEIGVRERSILKNKENENSMKSTNSLLLQYEQTLKAELESRRDTYNRDREVFKERISSYTKNLQSYKEKYFQNPLAQNLLVLQAEKEQTESRIKAFDDQITVKEEQLKHLADPVVDSFSQEKQPEGGFDQQLTVNEVKKYPNEDEDSSVDISSIHPKQTNEEDDSCHIVEKEQYKIQDAAVGFPSSEKENGEPWSDQLLNKQSNTKEVHSETEEDPKAAIENHEKSTGSDLYDPDELQKIKPKDEGEEELKVTEFHQPSYEGIHPQAVSGETPLPSTTTFGFNFSPTSSPHRGPTGSKSPAFLFNLSSNVSTPSFSGFGFEMGSLQNEDSAFPFSGPFFNEKRTSEAKSSNCNEFMFDQPHQDEEFQFAFTAKSPQPSTKDNTKDEFSFPFNF